MENINGPWHVGIILDGNRRYARRRLMEPWKGHEIGMKRVEELFDWCKDLKIKELTLYAFSIQNFKRDKKEVNLLMKIFKGFIDNLLKDDKFKELNTKFKFIGRIHLFPKDVHQRMTYLMDKTKNYKKRIVNIAMAYGGQEEIVDAIKKICEKVKKGIIKCDQIDKSLVEDNLYIKSQPDFIIRSGGDQRTSNFLIWQSWYSEWFFLKKTWPEIDKEDLASCIEDFKKRDRRFGK